MLIQIDMSIDKPIYEQIRDAIIKGILKGELTKGKQLPSSRALASSLSVNMHTVNKAYNILKQDGFVSVIKRKGVVINDKNQYRADEAYLNILEEKLESIVTEAKCRGLTADEINSIIGKIYNQI
ncbi:GntR family transcriptional regulator [Clostridiaceae bacterium M8S5]|nr:GntR family transcriptional regulator [Clostridiaceae bacterium M8S5]